MSLRKEPVLLAFFLFGFVAQAAFGQFTLVDSETEATVLVPSSEPEPVRLAAEDLVRDVRKITGEDIQIVRDLEACSASCVVLGTVAQEQSRAVVNRFVSTPISAVEGKWESYRVQSVRPSSPVGRTACAPCCPA